MPISSSPESVASAAVAESAAAAAVWSAPLAAVAAAAAVVSSVYSYLVSCKALRKLKLERVLTIEIMLWTSYAACALKKIASSRNYVCQVKKIYIEILLNKLRI